MKPNPVTRICETCGKPFTRPASQMLRYKGGQRFCSHECRGLSERKRVTLTCDRCGRAFEKIPSHVWSSSNYCSDACARADHGSKITGERHPKWQGGYRGGYGVDWPAIRLAALLRAGEVCEECGVSNDQHRAMHGCDLHVHHRIPFRVSGSHAPENLQVLCVQCHAQAESKVSNLRPLTPIRTSGKRPGGAYDRCPQCKGKKARHAHLCRSCKTAKHRAESTRFVCPICGGYKANTTSPRCWECRVARRT